LNGAVTRRLGALLAVLALLAASCLRDASGIGESASTPPAPTPPASTATTTGSDCDEAAAGDLALVCEASRVIQAHYVDPVDATELAAAAADGIGSLAGGGPAAKPATCSLSGAFASVCESVDEVGAPAGPAAEAAVEGMVRLALDPYSAYLDPAALALIEEEQAGRVEGIGALVGSEDHTAVDPAATPCRLLSDTCRLIVVSTIAGSPAERAGVLPGDWIVRVDGVDVAGRTVDEVTGLVRGPAGTEVVVGFERGASEVEIAIVRAAVEVPVVESAMVGPETGYLRLNVFTENAGPQVRAALSELIGAGATTLVLDLRDNPGGALTAAIDVASQFLDEGLVLMTEGPEGERPYPVEQGGLATDSALKVVVVVNRGSASAAEVVTGALQESGRAVVVGEATFGKNTVQQRFSLSNGGAIKLTVARWVTPGGTDFGGGGLAPDVAGEFPAEMTPEAVAAQALDLAANA
jgi:carboxyl-terminal processing protease